MPFINELTKEIIFKVVYCGPACAGKRQNFEIISKIYSGNLISKASCDEIAFRVDNMVRNVIEETGCIIYCSTISIFNVKWLENYKIKFHLETISRVSLYVHEWKKLLINVDGIVFVADSQAGRLDSNYERKYYLGKYLMEEGLNINDIPFVLQLNKQDLPNLCDINLLKKELLHKDVPVIKSVAFNGQGVIEVLSTIVNLVLHQYSLYIVSALTLFGK